MRIEKENWDHFYPDCLPLFEEHEAEIGDSPDEMPLAPANTIWEALDKADMLQIITAREDTKLIGYCLFVLGPSLKSKHIICGEQKLWFVTKNRRKGGLGLKLFLESIKYMKEKGVQQIYPHIWVAADPQIQTALRKFFTKLGARKLEEQYSLRIGV